MGGDVGKFEEFYSGINKFLEYQLFLSLFRMILKSGICPETTPSEFLKSFSYMWVNKWVQYVYEKGKITVVVVGYRIEKFDPDNHNEMPKEEKGNILYLPIAVSVSEDKFALQKLFNRYIDENGDIEEVIFYERNSRENLKRFKVNKGGKDVRSKITSNS